MKLMLKILAFFIPVLVVLFYFLGRPADTVTNSEATTGKLVKLAKLPSPINESSGVEFIPERDAYVTHNDAGNKPHLYLIDRKGKLIETIKLQLPNVDWEDLARDSEGNIYIADTGNNNNKRKELAIYKLQLDKPDKIEAIRFTYEDQKAYPPSKKDMNYDVEAIFWQGGKLYLVSKDRGQKETAKVYELPGRGGQHDQQFRLDLGHVLQRRGVAVERCGGGQVREGRSQEVDPGAAPPAATGPRPVPDPELRPGEPGGGRGGRHP